MSVYSNIEIIESIKNGHIVQFPAAPELINASSVDVRLGYNFYRTGQSTKRAGRYNPYDEEDVQRYFGKPLEAVALKDIDYFNRLFPDINLKNIDPEQPVIILRPGERILAHTHEFIGIRAPGTSSMQAKSTTGRNGVTVCKDAGWGDPGYINRWTMEIQNENEDEHVPLLVGMPIAQIVFHHTGPVESDYSSLSGNYQHSTDLDQLIKNWTPEQMLPRAYRQRASLPTPIDGMRYK